jgi:SWI/SNF-related matrix-associated actin-dependent regulator of chromatin subfamily A3
MPKATQPEALSTELHDFQLQGLHWLLEKESPELPSEGTKDVVQLWQSHPTVRGTFTNLATNFSLPKPTLASGGILADDMGLGKTIQIISLIMADRQLGRRASDACNATLILAPVSVMSNWSTQIKKHIKEEHALRVMFYHGNRKEPITTKSVGNFDVVISTYDSVSSEWHSQNSTTLPRKSGVFSVKWRRVILDEGHNIRNPKAKKTVAVSNLLAQSRWALTGTPIINNLKDLFSLVRFLRLSGGLDSLEIFHAAIMRPVMAGDARGNRVLQMLMAGTCLRRKKEMPFIDLRLPDLAEYVHKVTLLPHEQEKYDAFEAQAKGTLDLYRKKAGGRNASDTYRHLLEVLLRMRQLCNHWKMISDERIDSIMTQLEAEGTVDLNDENRFALQKMLQLSIDSQEDCPICLDSYKDPLITKCAHIFCTACIERVIETQHKCPMCRAELDSLATTTVKPAKEVAAPPASAQEQLANKESLESNASSKVNALMSILKASAQDPTNKTIVFSQWTTFLTLLEAHLVAANMKFTRIDGSMTATARDAALDTFDTSPTCTIMLASLSVCSVGLNLVAANQVILSDSWWAPAIEDQAVDRVHRLGQKRETKVFRLVVEGSIEERVLGIQEDKRKLMGLAFAEKESGKKRRATGVADLERLLGTQPGGQ